MFADKRFFLVRYLETIPTVFGGPQVFEKHPFVKL